MLVYWHSSSHRPQHPALPLPDGGVWGAWDLGACSRTADNTQSVFEPRAAQRASQLGAMTMSLEVKTRTDTEHWSGESAETLQRKVTA